MPASTQRSRGRPPTIDREDVLETALGLLDGEGVEALTMRRLASELGVSDDALPLCGQQGRAAGGARRPPRGPARVPPAARGSEGRDADAVVNHLRQPRG